MNSIMEVICKLLLFVDKTSHARDTCFQEMFSE